MEDRKPIFVVDASVIIKWAIKEAQNLEEAMSLRRDFLNERVIISVPGHCFSEIGNLLRRIDPSLGNRFLSFLISSALEEQILRLSVATKAFQLTAKYKDISFYDAVYHALAIEEKAIFLTADEKYFKKTKRERHIMLLKNYTTLSSRSA